MSELEVVSLDGKSLADLRGMRAETNKSLHEIFDQAGPELDMSKVTVVEGDSATKAAEIQRLNAVSSAIGEKIDELGALEGIRDNLPTVEERKSAGKSIGLDL